MNRPTRRRSTAMALPSLFAVTLAACGGGDSKASKPKRDHDHAGADHHDRGRRRPRPLTGLPDPTGASHSRPALSVKVENTDAARPQAGIDQADVLYEEVVEGGITRFVAMFNSTVPDVDRPGALGARRGPRHRVAVGGIFAYSGGAPVNVDAINAAPVHAVDEDAAGAAMVRNQQDQPPRDAPAQPLRPRPAAVRPRRRPEAAAGAVPVPRRRRAGRHRPGRPRLPRGLRPRVRPHVDVGRRHRHRGTRSIDGTPQTVTGSGAHLAGERGGPVHALHRRGRGADRGRGRRVGVHRRRAAHRAVGAPRQGPARQVRRRRRATRSCCARAARGSSCSRSGSRST